MDLSVSLGPAIGNELTIASVWVLDLHTSTDRDPCLRRDTLRRYMNEARKYYTKPAGLQELIKTASQGLRPGGNLN
jgi:hypothetical protein